MTGRKYPGGSGATFNFDSVANRNLMADNLRRHTYTHDAIGQMSQAVLPGSMNHSNLQFGRSGSLFVPDRTRAVEPSPDRPTELTEVATNSIHTDLHWQIHAINVIKFI